MTTVVDNAADQSFSTLADPYRREIMAHCYRMLGSVHDAEDLVQETYLRAWRAYERFEGRSSLRTWLHRIATTACLTALESRGRRPLPTGLGGPTPDPEGELVERTEVPWLEPVPDAVVGADDSDPGTVVVARESVRLAFVAALQHLPPRQRAVLVLRDVLRFRAAEVAEALDTSTTAVNSLLQRARAELGNVMPTEDEVAEPGEREQRELLDRYVAAFENYDVAAMVELFSSEAVWEMPPFLTWTRGAENIGRLIATNCPAQGPGDQLLIPTTANGQPAFGLYMRDGNGEHQAFHLQVLTVTRGGVSHVAAFFDTTLFPAFGLPMTAPAMPWRRQP
ncbi:RNA polymerase sigma-70 factor (ECF subfamily) [Lipingzhangella halophila]|uniref:RNA polymerase sigma factor n=1 Tax=Lipingzhangella halophila TaxID=1783352 RepID=A0A7W7RLM2_9ACTN|nr:sigma-70 family RNA polymerase sigma factor [Lipingzhangella halophila]MBB4934249.1 RNA polymerase sigma-70 factor (ECF subfamily) [Lipingzhangella halophila]